MKRGVQADPAIVDCFVEAWNILEPENDVWASILNEGWCYQFALVFQAVYGGTIVSDSPCHCWVIIDGLHYDSENLNGVEEGLWSYDYWYETNTIKDLRREWDGVGNSGPVREDVVELALKKYARRNKKVA
jgi:hypothetical protein